MVESINVTLNTMVSISGLLHITILAV